jgi:hypothetical protein
LPAYQPREKNVIQKILQDHFGAFEESYDDKYSERYGKYRSIHIKETVERFVDVDAPVFTVPKLLRPYFKYDRNLFEDVSKIIFSIVNDYYSSATKID